jgi:nanoRNase/pAp phosphatase (c-di-AMP/oligoRNAs hydrolase)
MATTQLRRYELPAADMSAFIEWWRSTLVPVRAAFGFEVVFAAANTETGEFTWAVSHDGDFAAAEATYMESDARTEALSQVPTRTSAQHISMVTRVI